MFRSTAKICIVGDVLDTFTFDESNDRYICNDLWIIYGIAGHAR